jgi:Phage integrase family
VAAALVISLAVVGPAMAGTLQLTFDAYDNAPPGCEIWSTNGDSAFGMDPPCSEAALGFYGGGGGSLPAGARVGIQTTAPPGIAINSAFVSPYDIYNLNNGQGWGGGSYYAGGGSGWTNGAAYEQDSGFSSSYWGFQMICGFSVCTNYGGIYLNSIVLTATEDQAPGLIALGNNLWYQGAHDVWNPPGDPWSIALESSDPSGVCSMSAVVNGVTIPGPSASPNTSVWQQCPDQTWTTGATVDTRDFVGTSGPLSLTLSATNAAGVTSSPSETLDVDNDPVTVSLATLNDPNPSVWVNHAVALDATAHAGPSGVGSLACSVDGVAAQAYPSGGVTINGTGVHTASCTATNQAVDPQGVPNSGSGSMSIKIDETPPNVLIEPSDPSDPTELVADTSDGQSGVAGGSFAMRPVGRGYRQRDGSSGRRGLVPRVSSLPWIPTDAQWRAVLEVAAGEPLRNRLMLALAYDAALRREELCLLGTDDLDPAHRTITVGAETTKTRRGRVVPYSAVAGQLLAGYLVHRRTITTARGALFVSESPRNRAAGISPWTWSKVVRSIAVRAGVHAFSTHTLRHLCLTDLARSGWELHQIAAFAGHQKTDTTQRYIHLSGRDLADRLASGMSQIHAQRVAQIAEVLS